MLSVALETAELRQVIMLYVPAVCGTTVVELSQPVMLFSCAVCKVGNGRI